MPKNIRITHVRQAALEKAKSVIVDLRDQDIKQVANTMRKTPMSRWPKETCITINDQVHSINSKALYKAFQETNRL